MDQNWKDRWNDRYRNEEYAYGKNPNSYLKTKLDQLNPGIILFPAEGEGRNAVYAAKTGWTVSAFDISEEGQKKALQLADMNKVQIDYLVGELANCNFSEEQFDAIALIYTHFPVAVRSLYFHEFEKYLKKGGVIIFEAFSKNHIEYVTKDEKVGGPRDIESLFSMEEILADFPNCDFEELVEKEIDLNEGLFHIGRGMVIRFLARKR